MVERVLFLTGRLAHSRVQAMAQRLALPDGSWRVVNLGVKVAALMTEAIIRNRLPKPVEADRVILPGRCRVDLGRLSSEFGASFESGPDELIDLPLYFGRAQATADLSQHDMRIFAEIVDAPSLAISDLVARANWMREAGADIIDIGCQPGQLFSGLEAAIASLKKEGHRVSIDSGDADELRRGALAGADFLLSLDELNIDLIDGTAAVPVLTPNPHGDLASLARALDAAKAKGVHAIADPILDPIHFGFTESIGRYAELRRLRPTAEILMGTGNLTELTEADSGGVATTLLGICSELVIRNLLVVQVSPHTRRTIEEHDAARRLMHRSKAEGGAPKGYRAGLLMLHDRRPYASTPDEISDAARAVSDPNFRIEVAVDGIHVYNRHGHHISDDAFKLFPLLDVNDDGPHAFYLGYELAMAEIAWKLGKRFAQDAPLDWGVATDRPPVDAAHHQPAGSTLEAAKRKRNAENR